MFSTRQARFSRLTPACALAGALLMAGAGCAWSDDDGRLQGANPPPQMSLSTLHSDIKFNLVAPGRRAEDPAALALQEQARRILAGLQAAAVSLYPEPLSRIGAFDVFVADSREISVLSSATGRIALNAGFAELAPTDDWLALVLAREMAHVVAGHHDNNSTASIVTSVLMNIFLPGSSLIKSAISFAGSQVASSSGRERQLDEADAMAIRMLETAGYTVKSLALNLALGPGEGRLGDSGWAKGFASTSRALLASIRPAPGPVLAGERREAPVMPLLAATRVVPSGSAAVTPLPEEPVVRRRPSGLPGPLLLGGHLVQPRILE